MSTISGLVWSCRSVLERRVVGGVLEPGRLVGARVEVVAVAGVLVARQVGDHVAGGRLGEARESAGDGDHPDPAFGVGGQGAAVRLAEVLVREELGLAPGDG